MKYYKVTVYKATVCNMKPFVNIEKLGKTVVAKSKKSNVVTDPNTGVEISIQKSRNVAKGLIQINLNLITQNSFCLFVY